MFELILGFLLAYPVLVLFPAFVWFWMATEDKPPPPNDIEDWKRHS